MALIALQNDVAETIQLAITPIFLLTGIGSILNVLAGRLARAVDRARHLEDSLPGYPSARKDEATAELAVLHRRMTAANQAIFLCTLAALLVCALVATLFIGDFSPVRFPVLTALLFTTIMGLLIVGLALFLYEIQIALTFVRTQVLQPPPE